MMPMGLSQRDIRLTAALPPLVPSLKSAPGRICVSIRYTSPLSGGRPAADQGGSLRTVRGTKSEQQVLISVSMLSSLFDNDPLKPK